MPMMPGGRLTKIVLGAVAALAVIVGIAITVLLTYDFRPFVGSYLTDVLGGRVRIGTLVIRWGNPIGMDLKDVHLVDASWDTGRDLLRIDSAVAELAPWSLLRGAIEYRSLHIDGASLLLERGPGRQGNWKHRGVASAAPTGSEVVPLRRTSFPTLIDFSLHNGSFTYRGSGTPLKLQIDTLTIKTSAEDQPVGVVLDGAYNGMPAKLMATTDPFMVMRNASVPWKAIVKIQTATSTADFEGGMMDPLNFDDVTGSLRLEAHSLADVLTIFGAPAFPTPPIQAVGALTRNGNAWQWANLNGKVGADAFTGGLGLNEGVGENPDAIAFALTFPQLDGKALSNTWTVTGPQGTPLQIEAHPGATIDGRINAGQFKFGATNLPNFAIHARTMPGEATVDDLTFGYAGGTAQASAQLQNVDAGARLHLAAALAGADTGQVARILGAANGQISGRLDARADLDMTGKTVEAGLKNSNGQAVVSIVQGRVARELVELLSTDLRALFHGGEGSAALTCVLAVVEMRNGVGVVEPLRLRSPEIAVIPAPKQNRLPAQDHLDLRLTASLPHSTGFLALDIPLEITGTLARPSARPLVGSAAEIPNRMPALSADLTGPSSDRNPATRVRDRQSPPAAIKLKTAAVHRDNRACRCPRRPASGWHRR